MFSNLGLQQAIWTTLGDRLLSVYRPFTFPEVTSMWILNLKPKHTSFILCTLFKPQPLENNSAYLSSSLATRRYSSG